MRLEIDRLADRWVVQTVEDDTVIAERARTTRRAAENLLAALLSELDQTTIAFGREQMEIKATMTKPDQPPTLLRDLLRIQQSLRCATSATLTKPQREAFLEDAREDLERTIEIVREVM